MNRAQKVLEALSHLTAKSRRELSAPAKYLLQKGHFQGRILDHGCGRGDICKFTDLPHAEQWDPHWHPERPEGKFDTIYSGFVLNTVPRDDQQKILNDIQNLLSPHGTAYIAVRRDIQKELGKEGKTSKGTEQYDVYLSLPLLVTKSDRFAIYTMRKNSHE